MISASCDARLARAGAIVLLAVLVLFAAPLTAGGAPPVPETPGATLAAAADSAAAGPAPSSLLQRLPARSVEAQAAYRSGQEAAARGETSAARRQYQEAIRIDPTFPDPHFALAATRLPFRPDLAVGKAIDGFESAWRTFRGQHTLVLNLCMLMLAIVVLTIVGTAVLVTARGLGYFQHPIFEILKRRLPAPAAALAAWILLVQPVLWGVGLFLLLVLAAGLLWFYQNRGERKVSLALLALALLVPLAFNGLSRMAAPLNPESTPYLLSAASESPDQPGLMAELRRAMAADPEDPHPHMALGLVYEKAGRLDDAESEYRASLSRSGDEGRLRNNLGNILARTGRLDEAEREYRAASSFSPDLAAPHFNLSLLHARRLQFDLADQEMKQASELDFEGVRAAMGSAGSREQVQPYSLGLAPAELWQATWDHPVRFSLGVPRALAWLYGGPMPLLPVLAAILFGVGLAVGRAIFRFLPTYSCANCQTVVCRKCLRRIRRRAYCAHCGDTILSMQTSEFTRMLLERRLKEEPWPVRLGRMSLKLLIPGWEAVRRGRPLVGLATVALFMIWIVPGLANGAAVRMVPSLPTVPDWRHWVGMVFGLAILYALSGFLLRILPEPESGLLGADLSVGTRRDSAMDRAA